MSTAVVDQKPAAPAAPAPGTPEYDAAMAAKFDGQNPAPATTQDAQPPARPAWLPEQFKDEQAFVAAYQESVKKLNELQRAQADARKAAEGQQQQQAQQAQQDGQQQQQQNPAGATKIDWQAFQQAYAEKGEISDEQYAEFEAVGIPRQAMERYVSGQKAMDQLFVMEVHNAVGGEQSYNAIRDWAKANLKPGELQAIDNQVRSGSSSELILSLQGLQARMKAAGAVHAFVDGKAGAGGAAGDVYESWPQAQADMRDPRYAKDPAFRAKVEAKIGRSDKLPTRHSIV